MKKALVISSILLLCIWLIACTAKNKTQYDIADHVTKENREILIDRAEKGKVLYKLHCASCHGIFTPGRDSVPNFTKIQIDNYQSAALIAMDPTNHAVAQKMSAQQIDYVITFLRLRSLPKD